MRQKRPSPKVSKSQKGGVNMGNIRDKFLGKFENGGNKKSIENLVVFVIILIATIIFINYIWNGDKKDNNKDKTQGVNLAGTTNTVDSDDCEVGNSLEKQLEDILKKLEGVGDVKVLITYSETNRVIPMYNEDNTQSTTKEEDNRRGC